MTQCSLQSQGVRLRLSVQSSDSGGQGRPEHKKSPSQSRDVQKQRPSACVDLPTNCNQNITHGGLPERQTRPSMLALGMQLRIVERLTLTFWRRLQVELFLQGVSIAACYADALSQLSQRHPSVRPSVLVCLCASHTLLPYQSDTS